MAHDTPAAHAHAHARVDHSAHPTAHAHDEGEVHVHIVPMSLLVGIFAVLIFLTIVTYAVTMIDLGYTGNLILAIAIAVVKSVLVALYFMHLRWDNPFNTLSLLTAILFVGLFIVIASIDSGQYQPLREAYLKMYPR
jgi:cytochrome c oxidase subunit IV